MPIVDQLVHSVIPGYNLCVKELLHALLGVESTPATVLHSTKSQAWLILDGHAIYVNSTGIHLVMDGKTLLQTQLTQIEAVWPGQGPFGGLL
jgi:hypothetical protein